MTRIPPILLFLALVLPAHGAEATLADAQRHCENGECAEAVAIALPKAADTKLAPEERFRAYAIAGKSYEAMQCPHFAIGVYQQAMVTLAAHPVHVADAWAAIAAVHIARARHDKAAQIIEKAMAELDLDALPFPQQSRLLSALAACRKALHQPDAALAAHEALLAMAKTPDQRVRPIAEAAQLHASLYRFTEAGACLDRLGGMPEGREAVGNLLDAYRRVVERSAAANNDEATRALCRKLIALFADSGSTYMSNIVTAYLGLAKDDGAVLDAAAGFKGDAAKALASQYVLDVLVPAAIRTGRTDEMALLCVRAMLATPLRDDAAAPCLTALMRLRLSAGRPDDALAAAKAAYSVLGYNHSYSSASRFATAVGLAARALRARDGHLAGGNRFRQYQVYGPHGPDRKPGTADDMANPLANVAFKADPAFDKLFQAALDAVPPTADGHRERGWIYLLWCKPDKALTELKRAFALCPLDSTYVQRVAHEIAMGLRALYGTPIGIDAFANYQRYGPNGKDGKAGTKDDLKDPLAKY